MSGVFENESVVVSDGEMEEDIEEEDSLESSEDEEDPLDAVPSAAQHNAAFYFSKLKAKVLFK